MAVQIQLRNDTAANWTSADPTLAAGELGIETDTSLMKIGDGTTSWTSLSYFAPDTNGVIAQIVDSAPTTLDTLNELAAALGDDANFANTIANTIATKADASHTHSLVDVTDVTATAAELNVLDGITATTAELNYTDGVTSSIQTQIDAKTNRANLSNVQSGSYTLQASDIDKVVLFNNSSAANATVPSGVFTAGTRVDIITNTTNAVTFVQGAGLSLRSKDGLLNLDGQYKGATVFFYTDAIAYLIGDLS